MLRNDTTSGSEKTQAAISGRGLSDDLHKNGKSLGTDNSNSKVQSMHEKTVGPNLDDFLRCFFPSSTERIAIRAFKPKGAPDRKDNRPEKLSLTRDELSDAKSYTRLVKLNKSRGLYFCPNSGGHKDFDITRFNAVFVENDDLPIDEQLKKLQSSPLPPSILVQTRRSVHAYWLTHPGIDEEEWRRVQSMIIDYFDGDRSNKNPSRLMRLPLFDHIQYTEGGIDVLPVKVLQLNPDLRYDGDELVAAFEHETASIRDALSRQLSEPLVEGERNSGLFKLAAKLAETGCAPSKLEIALLDFNKDSVKPPLPAAETRQIARNAIKYGRKAKDPRRISISRPNHAEPKLPSDALHGIAGEIVRTIEPHTESSTPALLLQLLCGFGAIIGRTAHFRVEADLHFAKLFVVLVGASSKGRKGTSWGQIRRLLTRVDEPIAGRIVDGLSSGEGLIAHVQDQAKATGSKTEPATSNSADKRVIVVEPEFARVLKVMQREGNTLSSVLRNAWDTDILNVLTKSRITASRVHIAVIGHVTADELRRSLDETDTANGFANRFLWVMTSRSKFLPEGGSLSDAELDPFVERLREAKVNAQQCNCIGLDPAAEDLWIRVYPSISEGFPGLFGAITSRAEAQVRRIAMIYACLDRERVVRLPHLKAALAVWKYCEDSARYIFGEHTGNKVADVILTALYSNEHGISRTEIRDLLQRNTSASQIDAALKLLEEMGRIEVTSEVTGGKPRSRIRLSGDDNGST